MTIQHRAPGTEIQATLMHQYVKFDDNPAKRCATCQHFGHWTPAGYAWCLHGKIVFATPQTGCGYWVREPGSDDELAPDQFGRAGGA